uniref:Growth hormone 1 n=1 Tax=Homo sapiens TaxID=9606 RepID=B1A4H0_HUMAN|nr:growth hormone 1 isoform 5 [Homo sapiens]
MATEAGRWQPPDWADLQADLQQVRHKLTQR